MTKRIIIFISFFLFSLISYSQLSKIDSLRLELKTAVGNRRVDLLMDITKRNYANNLNEAKEFIKEAENLTKDYPIGQVKVLVNKARVALKDNNDYKLAINHLEKVLEISKKLSFKPGMEQAYNMISFIQRENNDLKGCEKTLDEALSYAVNTNNAKYKAETHNEIGAAAYYRGDLAKALDHFSKAGIEFEKLEDQGNMAAALMNVGVINFRLGNNKESLGAYYKAKKVQTELKDSLRLATVIENIAITKSKMGNDTSAIKDFEFAIEIYKLKKDFEYLGGCMDNIGNSYLNLGHTDKALKYYLEGATIKEKEKNIRGLGISYRNIGSVYNEINETEKALEYYNKAKEFSLKANDELLYAQIIHVTGMISARQKDFEQAEKLFSESMQISKRLGDMPSYANTLAELGSLHIQKKDPKTAISYFLKALEIKTTSQEKHEIAGLIYSIGTSYYDMKNYKEAIKYLSQALQIRKETQNIKGLAEAYSYMANTYGQLRDYKNAYEYHVLFHDMWDSVYNSNISQQITEMNTKFETVQKDKEILQRKSAEKVAVAKAEKEEQERKNAENKLLFAIIGVTLLLVLAGFVIYGNIQRKKTNEKLALQNNEINQQKTEIEKQKHLVDEKQKEILDSITYAKRLQQAILPPLDYIKSNLPDSFVLYLPKDIVAGDFYWAHKADDLFFIAAADCTGHGVPGAMVSVVCSNALNRTVKEFSLNSPGLILDKTRELVVETFEKSESEVKDGMDISLLCIDKKNHKVYWSGANNPLWYIQNNELIEVKATKQPIGKTDQPQPFVTNEINALPGSTFYLITDGYPDQFGGPKGKKYKHKQLQEKLLCIHNEHPETQKDILTNSFINWRGDLEQVDDVCIIGVKI